MRNIITTDVLKTMISDELEDYRLCGEDFRHELVHAVIRDLNVPEKWVVTGEYHNEFGGLFPVQIRFIPPHGRFNLALCSPGNFSPVWMVVILTASGLSFSVVRTMLVFNPDLINHTLSLVARLEKAGYSADGIIRIMSMKEVI